MTYSNVLTHSSRQKHTQLSIEWGAGASRVTSLLFHAAFWSRMVWGPKSFSVLCHCWIYWMSSEVFSHEEWFESIGVCWILCFRHVNGFGSHSTLLSKYWRYNSLTRPPTLHPDTCLLWICTCWWRERRITSTSKHKPELPGMWSYKRDQILSLIRSFLVIRPSSLSNPFSLTHICVVLTLSGWAPSRVDHRWCAAVIISHELLRLWVTVWASHSLRWGESFLRHARLHLNRSSRQGREGRSRK